MKKELQEARSAGCLFFVASLPFRISDLFRISCFVFRACRFVPGISCLGAQWGLRGELESRRGGYFTASMADSTSVTSSDRSSGLGRQVLAPQLRIRWLLSSEG